MTPTPEQKHWLKDYLYKTMQYRETYEEVYDHVLLALENHSGEKYFETAVLNILKNDFGGNNGLLELEENCRQSIEVTAEKQFRDNFKRWFLTPSVLFTGALFATLLYLQLSSFKTGVAFVLLFLILLIAPIIICSVRKARLGYKFGETKASIKDDIFRRLAFKSNRMLWEFITISGGAQLVANFFLMLNNYLAMFIGLFLALSLVWPPVKGLLSQFKTGVGNVTIVPLKERSFFGWLAIALLATDLIIGSLIKICLLYTSPSPRD